MSTNQEIISSNENTVAEEYAPKKSNIINLFVFLGCIIIAFAIWCYANFTVDPMIEKELFVEFKLEGGSSDEYITPVYHYFTFYGPKSAFEDIKDNSIAFTVKRSMFENYDEPTTIKLKYDDNYHSHVTEVELILKVKNTINNDQNTDK